jgi:hypothetical protein
VAFYDDAPALHYGAEYVLYLAHGRAVEGTMQAGFVHPAAPHFAKSAGVELAGAPGGERQVHQGGLPGAGGYPERPILRRSYRGVGRRARGGVGDASGSAPQPLPAGSLPRVEVQAPRLLSIVCVIFSLI